MKNRATRKILIVMLPLIMLCMCCEAQTYLVLDSYKLTGFKRIRYSEGDVIRFRLHDFKKKYMGEILRMNDSTLFIKGMEVPLKMIDVVYREKGNFLTKSFSKVFIWGGLGFIVLDSGNNLIAKNPTVIEKRAVIAGGAIALVGLTMRVLSLKKYRMGNKNSLKVLTISDDPH